MKLANIKLKVETDEENQYVVANHLYLNKEDGWCIIIGEGEGSYSEFESRLDTSKRHVKVCSVWKGFRYLSINEDGELYFHVFKEDYEKEEEKEISFDEFNKIVKQILLLRDLMKKND